jgi:hypothetical protein
MASAMPWGKSLSLCLPEGVRQTRGRVRNKFLLVCGHEHFLRNLFHHESLWRKRIERLRLLLS